MGAAFSTLQRAATTAAWYPNECNATTGGSSSEDGNKRHDADAAVPSPQTPPKAAAATLHPSSLVSSVTLLTPQQLKRGNCATVVVAAEAASIQVKEFAAQQGPFTSASSVPIELTSLVDENATANVTTPQRSIDNNKNSTDCISTVDDSLIMANDNVDVKVGGQDSPLRHDDFFHPPPNPLPIPSPTPTATTALDAESTTGSSNIAAGIVGGPSSLSGIGMESQPAVPLVTTTTMTKSTLPRITMAESVQSDSDSSSTCSTTSADDDDDYGSAAAVQQPELFPVISVSRLPLDDDENDDNSPRRGVADVELETEMSSPMVVVVPVSINGLSLPPPPPNVSTTFPRSNSDLLAQGQATGTSSSMTAMTSSTTTAATTTIATKSTVASTRTSQAASLSFIPPPSMFSSNVLQRTDNDDTMMLGTDSTISPPLPPTAALADRFDVASDGKTIGGAAAASTSPMCFKRSFQDISECKHPPNLPTSCNNSNGEDTPTKRLRLDRTVETNTDAYAGLCGRPAAPVSTSIDYADHGPPTDPTKPERSQSTMNNVAGMLSATPIDSLHTEGQNASSGLENAKGWRRPTADNPHQCHCCNGERARSGYNCTAYVCSPNGSDAKNQEHVLAASMPFTASAAQDSMAIEQEAQSATKSLGLFTTPTLPQGPGLERTAIVSMPTTMSWTTKTTTTTTAMGLESMSLLPSSKPRWSTPRTDTVPCTQTLTSLSSEKTNASNRESVIDPTRACCTSDTQTASVLDVGRGTTTRPLAWRDFPSCEQVLRHHMDEYCSILLAVPYNSVRRDMIDNVLVHAVRKTASEAGLTVEQNIDDPTLRDHIHDFYRSHVQTALHRLKALRDRGANDKNVSTLDSFCASTTTSRCMGNDHHPAASSSTAKEPGATVQQGGNSSLDETPRHDCVTCRIIAPAGIAATTAPMRRETSSSESFPAQVGTSFRDQGREPSSLSDPASTFVPAVQESQGPEQETIPVMTEGFIWRDFPACERVLHNYTDRYNEIAASPNNSKLLIIFTNVLVHAVRKAARDSGAAMDPEWDDGMLREHIHMFYKEKSSSSPQNARRRQSKVTVTATSILEDHVGSDRAVRHLA